MVQLTVVSENEAARRLYGAMGFVEYGYEKRALKQDGRYYDEVLDGQIPRRRLKLKPNKKRIAGMNELDFSGKQVLVVGGSSGIGNGIAQAFRAKGAHVAVCGTRA